MRVLVTRPEPGATQTATRLAALGHEAILSPVSVLRPIAAPLPAAPFDAVIVSSANALRVASPDVLAKIGKTPVFTVGTATQRVAAALGLDAIAGPGTAEALPDVVSRRFAPPAALLYLAGEPRKPVLEQVFRNRGHVLDTHLCYQMAAAESLAPEAASALRTGGIEAILHFSRESAERFVVLATAAGLADAAAKPLHLCMSADVTAGLSALTTPRIAIADAPTEERLTALLDKDH